IKNLTIECKRVNIFIGRPNVGKSNILEALGVLSFSGYGGYLNKFVRFENMSNLFYDNDLSENIEISADQVKFRMNFDGSRFIGKCRVPIKEKVYKEFEVKLNYRGGIIGGAPIDALKNFKFYRFKKLNGFSQENPQFLLPPEGKNLLSVLLTHKELKSIIANIFKPYGLRITLKPQENKIEVVKLLEEILIGYPYSVLSDTLQRIVFYLTAIESNKNSVLIFEEPEAHAFPYYIKFLAERIVLEKGNQYFISTHNPYFLLSILEKIPVVDVNVFITYFEDYQTKVKSLTKEDLEEIMSLEIDSFLNIDRFLEG
ncbi:MAG: AAA family ATPase, partial [Thermoplasmata archaeon]|nr:AAA family ATPase [Thermoplasmata archaeon]